MSLLRVENLSIAFGGVKAVDGVGFEVNAGEVFTIIGPNGAGKTTVFNLISRIYPPSSGRMLFGDTPLSAYPHRVAGLGIAHVPEHRAVRARHGARQPADRPALPPLDRPSPRAFLSAKGPRAGLPTARLSRR